MKQINAQLKSTTEHAKAFYERAGRKAWALLLVLACALGMLSAIFPFRETAWAEVLSTDVIEGKTLEQRGIEASRCPNIDAKYAYLVTGEGKVYFERDAYSPTQIASITKIMTACIALEYAPLDTIITVTPEAGQVGESSAHLLVGDRLTLHDALMALMIPSGNDAAIAIAQNLGPVILEKGLDVTDEVMKYFQDHGIDTAILEGNYDGKTPYDVFVAAMNVKAAQLGLTDTVFENPHGLDMDNYAGNMRSTAQDVATMCLFAMNNETFRTIVAMGDSTINVTRADGAVVPLTLQSTDYLIGRYDGACGIKTGYTERAGNSFAGACTREGEYLYAIVLDSTSEMQRFTDAETLYNWYYNNFIEYPLVNTDEYIEVNIGGQNREVPIVAEVTHTGWIDKTVKATVADPQAEVDVFALDGNISQDFDFFDLTGDIHPGDVIGSVTYMQHNQPIAEMDLIAAEEVLAPNIIESIGIWWQRFFGGFSGEAETAESFVVSDMPLVYDKSAAKTYNEIIAQQGENVQVPENDSAQGQTNESGNSAEAGNGSDQALAPAA